MFENQLKKKNPNVPEICYDLSDLYGFLDGLHDISALVYVFIFRNDLRCNALPFRFHNGTRMYEPFGRDW
jgi:hypothetical protein